VLGSLAVAVVVALGILLAGGVLTLKAAVILGGIGIAVTALIFTLLYAGSCWVVSDVIVTRPRRTMSDGGFKPFASVPTPMKNPIAALSTPSSIAAGPRVAGGHVVPGTHTHTNPFPPRRHGDKTVYAGKGIH
jgi:hypothetical protein